MSLSMTFFALTPVLTAGLAIFVLGHLWYHPRIFGRAWLRLTNLTPEMAERSTSRSFLAALLGLAGALFVAVTLQYFGTMSGAHSVSDGARFAASLWLGLLVPVLLGQMLWEGKSVRLFAINAGYWLLSLVGAAVLLFL